MGEYEKSWHGEGNWSTRRAKQIEKSGVLDAAQELLLGNKGKMARKSLEDRFDVEMEFGKLVYTQIIIYRQDLDQHKVDSQLLNNWLKAMDYLEARKQYLMAAEIAEYAADRTKNKILYERAIKDRVSALDANKQILNITRISELHEKRARL